MPYKYIEGLTVADIAFEASGKTLGEMFESAGLAMTNTMVKDLRSVSPRIKKTVKLKNRSIERLLFSFLQEFVYWKDSKCLLFPKVSVRITEARGTYNLSAALAGDKLDMNRHELVVDVKAVTMHKFEVKKEKTGWKCVVVLDI